MKSLELLITDEIRHEEYTWRYYFGVLEWAYSCTYNHADEYYNNTVLFQSSKKHELLLTVYQ